ncbi:MAG: hypothetical protein HQ567_11245 [Candidatus Nealsonbacteria bacterium]|nr:hypothetical protein [Candidatus Nealsonbacteria bacterium]
MKVRGFREFVVFDPANKKPADKDHPDGPRPAETVEVFRVKQISESVRAGLALTVRMLVVQQLQGEEYDKTKVRNREKFIELPAPTLADPGRMKKHQILGVREEYRVTARLHGMPEIRIVQMPYLRSYLHGETGVLLFVAEIDVPVRGRVRYQIADAVTAETGFRTKIAMKMVGQFRAKKVDDEVTLEPPEVLQLRIDVRALDVSNDALSAVGRQIEELINDEIRKKRARILQQANKGIRKAVDVQQFRNPLVRYLALP